MRNRRGSSLGAVLAIVTVGLLAAFTMAANSSFNLQIAQRVENTQQASLLAESAVQTAIARLIYNGDWKDEIDEPGSRLTFKRNLGLPFSTNNRTGAEPKGWTGSKLLGTTGDVASERVHLVGVGTWRNVTRTVETVVYVPNFTVSIAASGKVSLKNTVVASLKNPAEVADVGSKPELLGPGDLATNYAGGGGDLAIDLDENSEVTGNIQAVGEVRLKGKSKVGGEVRKSWTPSPLPVFNLAEYDPKRDDTLNYQELPAIVGSQDLSGLVRSKTLTINGDLKLDNALLFVEGSLIVNGGIKGAGAVICTESATVKGGTNLSSDDQVALIANGDINLIGEEGQQFQFNGLVYTRGDFTATRFQIVGAFIANGLTDTKGKVTLTGCRMISTPVGAKVPIFYPRQIVIQIAGATVSDKKKLPLTDENELQYGVFPGTKDGVVVGGPNGETFALPWNTPQKALEHVNGPGGPGAQPEDDQWGWYDPVVVEVRKEDDKFAFYVNYNNGSKGPVPPATSLPERYDTLEQVTMRLMDISKKMCKAYNNGDTPDENDNFRLTKYYPVLWATFLQPPPPGQPVAPNFDFDPNRFLKEKDKVRISARAEY